MIELNSKNGWRAAFILLLWAFVFDTAKAVLLAEICGTIGGLLLAVMVVFRYEDVYEFMSSR